ncbi:transcript variant X2 [Nothobranchius furzeri]|uniref:Transcript variant X2 n=1 Tax=Nothobranchius furzeri TaxID=105023 RepID=A0A9D2Z2A2_NOTFU|nr:transcript variant X2 [Nothobranchius furzeri]
MMADLASSWMWLVVMLAGAVTGYPTKNDFYQPQFSQPAAEMRPVPALHASDTYPAHIYSEYGGSSPPQSGPQVPPNQGNWAIPPSTLHYGASSPDELGIASEFVPPGYPYPPGPFFPHPQPGELSYEEKSFEQGNYNSESEEQGPPAPPLQYFPHPALSRLPIRSPLALGALLDQLQFGYPYIDYMLLNRKRPPGTYTFSTNTYKHGKNQRHDSIGDLGAPVGPREELGPWGTKQPRPPAPQRV